MVFVAGLQNGTTTKVVRTLPEEVQERLLEFRQIGELGWRHKEEETLKKMVRESWWSGTRRSRGAASAGGAS